MGTNYITLTNYVWMVATGNVPVYMVNSNALPVTLISTTDQFNYFFTGWNYGFPLALTVGILWAIVKALRSPQFPS